MPHITIFNQYLSIFSIEPYLDITRVIDNLSRSGKCFRNIIVRIWFQEARTQFQRSWTDTQFLDNFLCILSTYNYHICIASDVTISGLSRMSYDGGVNDNNFAPILVLLSLPGLSKSIQNTEVIGTRYHRYISNTFIALTFNFLISLKESSQLLWQIPIV